MVESAFRNIYLIERDDKDVNPSLNSCLNPNIYAGRLWILRQAYAESAKRSRFCRSVQIS